MQFLITVACTKGESLREAIVSDPELEQYQFSLLELKRKGRNPGWAKLKSALQGIDGTLNLIWDSPSAILQCKILTRGEADPAPIIGDLIAYLLQRFPDRVQSITVLPRH
jgi:hypothetical protein